MSKCQICGAEGDLFAVVAQEPVCSICKVKFIGGGRTTSQLIAVTRESLGLKDGEYLKQDRGEEAARILGRKP